MSDTEFKWFGKEVEAQAIANMEAFINVQLEKVREETARNWATNTGEYKTGKSLSRLRRDPAKIHTASISGRVIIPLGYAFIEELRSKVMRRALRKNEIKEFSVF